MPRCRGGARHWKRSHAIPAFLTLGLTLEATASLRAQDVDADTGDPPPTTTVTVVDRASADPSMSTTVTMNEDGSEPVCMPQPSGWLDPLGVRFFAESGFNLVRPIQRGPALMGSKPAANAFGPAGVISTKFRYPLQVGPRVTLGAVTENHWGVMMSWWGFEDGATTIGATNTATSGVNFSSVPIPGFPGFTSPSPAAGHGHVNDIMTAAVVRMQVWTGTGSAM